MKLPCSNELVESHPIQSSAIQVCIRSFIYSFIHSVSKSFISLLAHSPTHLFMSSAKMLVSGGAPVWLYLPLHVHIISGQWNHLPFGVQKWIHW